MKRVGLKLDKIGMGFFIIVLVDFLLLLGRYDLFDLSKWQYVEYPLFLTLVAGLFLIIKTYWCKIISLFSSLFSLIVLIDQHPTSCEKISYTLNMLPHFIANGSISISEIFYFVLLPIFIAAYCIFEITTDVSNSKRNKIIQKNSFLVLGLPRMF